MSKALAGMPVGEVLRRFEIDGDADSAESLLLELDAADIPARMVHLRAGDLRFLEAPALIELANRTWLLLRAGKGSVVVVEGAHGVQRVTAASVEANGSGIALQILQELPAAFGQRKVVIETAMAALFMTLLALIPPLLTRVIVDRALPDRAGSIITLAAAAIVLVTAFQAWTGWLRARAILYLRARMETILSSRFLAHLLSLPFAYLNRKSRGELIQGVAGLTTAQETLTEQAIGSILSGGLSILYLVVMASILPAPALAVVLAALLMAALAVVMTRRQARWQREETDVRSEQRELLIELLAGIATVKAGAFEERGLHQWMRRLSRDLSAASSRQRAGLWSAIGLDTIRHLLTVLLLVWGARLVLDGRTTTGDLLAFLQLSSAFLGSVMGLANTWSIFTFVKPQLTLVTEALRREGSPRHSRRPRPKRAGPVTLENVWFRYDPNGPWILQDFQLEVSAGEKRWLRGPSGSGKSTILRLIAGLYPPEQGTIRVDGDFVYLAQFVQLYGGSILENLQIFSGHAKRQRIMEAAEASGLHALVSALPMGYETRLAPGAATLSGGERQLVALTAVMASDRTLLLLDEALASIDRISRSWIEQSSWFAGKTMIYASHDAGFADGLH